MNNKFEVCTGPVCCAWGNDLLAFLRGHPSNGVKFDVKECECSGNCGNTPVVFINGDDLVETTIEILEDEIDAL